MATATQTPLVEMEVQGQVMLIRMNRPEKKNALTLAMYEGMVSAMQEVDDTPELRAAVFAGSGGSFSAGNDVLDFMQNPPQDESSPVFRFLNMLTTMKKPLLAAVDGIAVGVGTTMLLHCDLAYATPNAKFHMPFVNLGLCPEAGSSLLLPAIAGHRKASEWILLGQPFGPQEAKDWGIINDIYEGSDLEAKVLEHAQRIAAQPPAATRLAKQLLKRTSSDAVQSAMVEEGNHFKQCLTSAEAAEAFTAFIEKRKPDFSNFS